MSVFSERLRENLAFGNNQLSISRGSLDIYIKKSQTLSSFNTVLGTAELVPKIQISFLTLIFFFFPHYTLHYTLLKGSSLQTDREFYSKKFSVEAP